MDIINSSGYLFLDSISYVPNILKIRISEGILGNEERGRTIGTLTIDEPSRPVEVTNDSKLIELVFDDVRTFEVRDEVFEVPNERKYGKPSRDAFREYSESEFLGRSGHYWNEHPKHYAIFTEWHVINVLSQHPPIITQLDSRQAQPPAATRVITL
jgi:hypothetical protein